VHGIVLRHHRQAFTDSCLPADSIQPLDLYLVYVRISSAGISLTARYTSGIGSKMDYRGDGGNDPMLSLSLFGLLRIHKA